MKTTIRLTPCPLCRAKDDEIKRLRERLATIRRALKLRDAIWDGKYDIDEITHRECVVLIQIEKVIARQVGG